MTGSAGRIRLSELSPSMDCFWSEILSGDLILREHEAAKWLTKEKLNTVDWLPADVKVVQEISKNMQDN